MLFGWKRARSGRSLQLHEERENALVLVDGVPAQPSGGRGIKVSDCRQYLAGSNMLRAREGTRTHHFLRTIFSLRGKPKVQISRREKKGQEGGPRTHALVPVWTAMSFLRSPTVSSELSSRFRMLSACLIWPTAGRGYPQRGEVDEEQARATHSHLTRTVRSGGQC